MHHDSEFSYIAKIANLILCGNPYHTHKMWEKSKVMQPVFQSSVTPLNRRCYKNKHIQNTADKSQISGWHEQLMILYKQHYHCCILAVFYSSCLFAGNAYSHKPSWQKLHFTNKTFLMAWKMNCSFEVSCAFLNIIFWQHLCLRSPLLFPDSTFHYVYLKIYNCTS